MLTDPHGTLHPWLLPLFIVAILIEISCGGGEGAYCGYISITSTDKRCTIKKSCKRGYTCEETNIYDDAGNKICECRASR